MNKRGISRINPKLRVLLTFVMFIVLVTTLYYTTKTISNLTGYSIVSYSVSSIENFTKCLTKKSIMYGSRTCMYCREQKRMFGDSFKYINYVECLDKPESCTEAGAKHVPMWKINGENYFGVKSLNKLAELSGCQLE